jgi:hypothetical protein
VADDDDEDDLQAAWAALRGPPQPRAVVVAPPPPPRAPPPPTPVRRTRRRRSPAAPEPPPPPPESPWYIPSDAFLETLMQHLWHLLAILTVGAFVTWLGWMLLSASRASGKIDMCYVRTYGDEFQIIGRIDWRDDITLDRSKTLEEALAHLPKVCPVGVPR